MKKEVTPAIIAIAAAAVLGLVVFIAWRMFGPEPPLRETPEARAEAKRWVEAFKSQGAPPQKQ